MAPSSITETIVLRLRKGVNLTEDVASELVDSNMRIFGRLLDEIKAQPGFIRQFWGHQVEDARVFVWYIDWESFEHTAAFVNYEQHISFMEDMGKVFDLELAAPLKMYSRFSEDTYAALASPVTEVAFFTLPIASRAAAQPMIHGATLGDHPVLTVGKSLGGAIAWVFDEKNTDGVVSPGESIALHGVFGYATVDDHYRWKATPEHAKIIEERDTSPLSKLGLKDNIRMPGGYIFVPDSSMFHVKFRPGF